MKQAFKAFVIAASLAFQVGCSDGQNDNASSADAASDAQTDRIIDPPARRANFMYRHLTALKEYPADVMRYSDGRPMPMSDWKRQLLALACQEALGFKIEMPVGIIKSARDIEIPVEHVLRSPSITIQKVREIDNGTKQVGEVFVNNEPTRVAYDEIVNLPGDRFVKGVCVGSEYIVE